MSARNLLAGAALAANRLLRPLRTPGFRIVLLHDVAPAQQRPLATLLGALAAHDRLIGPAQAEAYLFGAPLPPGPPPLLVSFDDGFRSNRVVAERILDPLGVRALFFVCPGLLDLRGAAQAEAVSRTVLRGQRPAPEPLMGWDDLESLSGAGHVIGNHTLTHPRLAGLAPDALAAEVGGGARILRRRFGRCDWFAFPFGDIDSIDAAALTEIGRHHRFCRSGVRGANRAATPPLGLRADHLDLGASPAWQRLVVEGGLDLRYVTARRRLDAASQSG
jgi:peptidoglycan/xylan/chitin deacetylase (PgdA/CDA1 family)